MALRLRNARTISRPRLLVAVALLAAVPLADEVRSLWALAGVTALLWGLVTFETFRSYGEGRARLRSTISIGHTHEHHHRHHHHHDEAEGGSQDEQG